MLRGWLFVFSSASGIALSACSAEVAEPKEAGAKRAQAAAAADRKPVQTVEAEAPSDAALKPPMVDPAWFRASLIEGSKKISHGRTEPDGTGRFSSQILVEAPEGMTAEVCADALMDKVSETVKGLKRETQPDGRVKITGTQDAYRITLLCGEAEGKTRAYLGYEWTAEQRR